MEVLVTAIVGMIGIRPTIAAIKAGKTIALANKETLVTAGHIIIPLAKEYGVSILPVDSEHSAIFQSLQGNSMNPIKKILLTASGGPFRGRKLSELEGIRVEDALKHPNWSMGQKITIDSSTMAKARSRLTASLRKDRRKIIAKGEKILKDFFESNHIEYNNDVVTKILSNLGIRHRDDLFYKIGNDEITPNENIKKIIKGKSQNPFMRYLKLSFGSNNGKNEQPKPVTPQQLTIDRKQTYILRDENGVKNYKVADCCCPIPGDDVLGYVEDDETVVVHKRECPVAMH
jgi:hypothetical protein